MAWAIRDADDDIKFQSCVKQCGVEWDASPLNLVDYLQSQAAYEKCNIKRIENVNIVNAALRKDDTAATIANNEHSFFKGKLDSTHYFARDIGKPFGMEPPDIYEELHYAWELIGKFDEMGDHEKAAALSERIEAAKKWDSIAIMNIRGLFNYESIELPGDYIDLTQFFHRDGIYPERADVDDRIYNYLSRWKDARHIGTLARLPMFGEKDIIKGSESENMPFDYKILVLRQDELRDEYRKPENILWTPRYDAYNGECLNLANRHPNTVFNVENMITGHVVGLQFKDFWGVLRPEYAKNIDFDALKKEYAVLHTEENKAANEAFEACNENEGDDEWEDEV
jgi:hypothetical protein